MVSTRSVKYKFAKEEKVLCYEPDPAKTKVLYNSKVLDVVTKKDENGRKVAHFLIHFQGWNSTWDRFVTEDFILKDTEENRKLQRELAEKAQLTAGCGNLYRKDRKKRTGVKGRVSTAGPGGKETTNVVANHTTSSPAPSETKGFSGFKRCHDEALGAGVTSSGSSHGGAVDDHSDPEGAPQLFSIPSRTLRAHFSISPLLKRWLEADLSNIKFNNKLVRVPAEPCAVDVLQMWMLEYSVSQIRLMCHKRGHLRPSAGKKTNTPTPESIYRAANLCREVSDGLRVFMDSMLSTLMLYEEERDQYSLLVPHDPMANFTNTTVIIKMEMVDGDEEMREENCTNSGETKARKKTLRSHSGTSSCVVDAGSGSSNTPPPVDSTSSKPDLAFILANDNTLNSNGEQVILKPMSSKEKELLKKVLSRKLVSDYFREARYAPSTIYGVIHLTRALVKIPELLAVAEYGEAKINLLLDYLTHFMKFLEEHPEWFSETAYVDRGSTLATSD